MTLAFVFNSNSAGSQSHWRLRPKVLASSSCKNILALPSLEPSAWLGLFDATLPIGRRYVEGEFHFRVIEILIFP
ncbi:MAG: hypothetical protein IPJ54_06750 [Saprospiraceae bacterium]|nr:hypothetical protein [Saprospiraceae bacterium]